VVDKLTFTDADGTYEVVRLLGYTDDGVCYCNCKTPIAEWPESGWQVFAWIYWKEGKHRCTYWRGWDADPTVYPVAGRELIGTLMDDDEYEWLCKDAQLYTQALMLKLDRERDA
jgi:hypothetical protein